MPSTLYSNTIVSKWILRNWHVDILMWFQGSLKTYRVFTVTSTDMDVCKRLRKQKSSVRGDTFPFLSLLVWSYHKAALNVNQRCKTATIGAKLHRVPSVLLALVSGSWCDVTDHSSKSRRLSLELNVCILADRCVSWRFVSAVTPREGNGAVYHFLGCTDDPQHGYTARTACRTVMPKGSI